ncbi:MAG: hypothetical protein AB7P03_24870 [Kofleriaceae bacterium]
MRPRRCDRALAIASLLALTSTVAAQPRKVMVLRLDGDAPPQVGSKIAATLRKLASEVDGNVSWGDTTFTETATVVGCDATAPACASDVLGVLGVDVLIYGTATTKAGETTLVVRRVAKEGEPIEATVTIANDEVDPAEPTLEPVFTGQPTTSPQSTGEPPITATGSSTSRLSTRGKGIIIAAGGGFAVVIGLVLWSKTSNLQDDIDRSPDDTPDDLRRIASLEDKASGYAMWGNIMMLGGLALGGWGGWILYKDHQARQVTVSPAPVAGGPGLTIGGAW